MATMLTAHLSLEGLTKTGKHQGINNEPPHELAGNALKLAEKLEQAMKIIGVFDVNYAFRSLALNAACKGSDTSVHLEFLAADILPRGMSIEDAFNMLVRDRVFMSDVDQIIIERGCIHIGLPGKRQNYHPRREMRKEAWINGERHYTLTGIWKPLGVVNA